MQVPILIELRRSAQLLPTKYLVSYSMSDIHALCLRSTFLISYTCSTAHSHTQTAPAWQKAEQTLSSPNPFPPPAAASPAASGHTDHSSSTHRDTEGYNDDNAADGMTRTYTYDGAQPPHQGFADEACLGMRMSIGINGPCSRRPQ
jgi:hypothetical protein